MKNVVVLLAMAAIALAQAPVAEKKAAFEAASIHLATDDGDHDTDRDGSIVRIHNLTLKQLIANGYEINNRQIFGGPGWLDSDSYNITAKIPAEFMQQTREKLPEMIQNLLADRFHLVIHRESRQISGYALVLAKRGAKMEQAQPSQQDSGSNANNTHMTDKNVSMEAFAKQLSRRRDIGELVVDKTGLKGGFNFTLDWMPERPDSKPDAAADERPSIFTAIEEQLGLKLERAKVPVQAIVIDSAEKPEID